MVNDFPVVTVSDPIHGSRFSEPIHFTIGAVLEGDIWLARDTSGQELICQRLHNVPADDRSHFVTVADFTTDMQFSLVEPDSAPRTGEGITELEPQESDAFVRLDTGYFDLELCRGTAQGTGASKWGIRHFSTLSEGVDLLEGGDNAIGGFYGPFFTPENGLINPPEHIIADIEVIERGPILHHYRLTGTVPDGLLPELRGVRFAVDWEFTYGTPWFRRRYSLDEFQTTVNGRSITNKITVGDEFEAGQGQRSFTRFEAYDGTCFRAGDPYAQELKTEVAANFASDTPALKQRADFEPLLSDDLDSAHWDLYWRLFSVWENVLLRSELEEALRRVSATAHIRADLNERPWRITTNAVNVSAEDDETIFSGPATKTVEHDPDSGRAMIWWTSQPSAAFQIVQRPQSGWGNWGTNGENECPALPTGTEIKTAYGPFEQNWRKVADQLETPPIMRVLSD
ncbi:hypothetical protein [Arthrobacter pigmenti]